MRSDDTDRGAVLVWIALMLTVLLGMAALVIDIGRLYVEKRELQNGADAAALAVALDCATLASCNAGPGRNAQVLADQLADQNARDGAAAVPEVCGTGPGLTACTDPTPPSGLASGVPWVRVKTATETSSGARDIDFFFAPVLGQEIGRAGASAAAAYGPLGSTATLPFIMCVNQWSTATLDGSQFPSAPVIIQSKTGNQNQQATAACPTSFPVGTASGNFGWLDSVAAGSTCLTRLIDLGAGGLVTGGDPGNDNPLGKSPCNYSETGLNSLLNKVVTVPLFRDEPAAGGNNVQYRVVGFAGFLITGYRIGNWRQNSATQCPGELPKGNERYFCGQFVKRVDDQGNIGGGSNFGVTVVKMVG